MSLVALRIGSEQWRSDESLERLRKFVRNYANTIDEIALFNHTTHAPLPLDDVLARAERLARVIPTLRRDGFRVGVNVLTTMGHHVEHKGYSLDEPWQRVVNLDGVECDGCFCPNDPRHAEYVTQVYERTAEANPDFIWVDDDVRLMGHTPVRETCFCDRCLEKFFELTGNQYTRAGLKEAFSGKSNPDAHTLRREWIKLNRQTIDQLLSRIERAVHAKAPAMELGFMTGDRPYEGYAFGRWAETLSGDEDARVRWRPGGGFYADDAPMQMVQKSHDVGRQCAVLPRTVVTLQSEIENFPYQPLRKSGHITTLEAASHIASGATGSAFNILTLSNDPLDEYHAYLRLIEKRRSFYQSMVEAFGRSPVAGLWPAWNQETFAANSVSGLWFEKSDTWSDLQRSYVLGEIGIPVCYAPGERSATVLAGDAPYAFSKKELKDMLGGGVLLDGKALIALHALGLGELTGVTVKEIIREDAVEVLSDQALNGPNAGRVRDCRQSFWHEPAYSLESTNAAVRWLGTLINYAGKEIGMSSSTYVNDLGGRVAVMGYFPWTLIHSAAKTNQLKAVADWLSAGQLPIVVETYAKVVPWARKASSGYVFALLNASWDSHSEVEIRINSDARNWRVRGTDQSDTSVTADPVTGRVGTVRLRLSDMQAWQMYLLTVA